MPSAGICINSKAHSNWYKCQVVRFIEVVEALLFSLSPLQNCWWPAETGLALVAELGKLKI